MAPVGPDTWTLLPPKSAATAPATIAVTSPRPRRPDAIPNASARGNATTPTVRRRARHAGVCAPSPAGRAFVDGPSRRVRKERRTSCTAERVPGGAPQGVGAHARATPGVMSSTRPPMPGSRSRAWRARWRAGSHGGQREGVDDPSTVATLRHQTRQPQDGELVRQARGLDVDGQEPAPGGHLGHHPASGCSSCWPSVTARCTSCSRRSTSRPRACRTSSPSCGWRVW